jgi:TPR repeat protein
MGHCESECLGTCHMSGDGVVVDKRNALTWYKRAADTGNSVAQCSLGKSYFLLMGLILINERHCQSLSAKAGNAIAQQKPRLNLQFDAGVAIYN